MLLSGDFIAPLPSAAPGGRVTGLPRAPGGNGGGCVAALAARGGGGGDVDGAVFTGGNGCGMPPDAEAFGGAGMAIEAPVAEPTFRGVAADGVIAIAATGAAFAGSFASRIAVSSARRASDPGGGGGSVFCLLRGNGASGSGAGVAFTSGAGESGSTVHPEARSAIRPFVASERRRRVRSSSGTPER